MFLFKKIFLNILIVFSFTLCLTSCKEEKPKDLTGYHSVHDKWEEVVSYTYYDNMDSITCEFTYYYEYVEQLERGVIFKVERSSSYKGLPSEYDRKYVDEIIEFDTINFDSSGFHVYENGKEVEAKKYRVFFLFDFYPTGANNSALVELRVRGRTKFHGYIYAYVHTSTNYPGQMIELEMY